MTFIFLQIYNIYLGNQLFLFFFRIFATHNHRRTISNMGYEVTIGIPVYQAVHYIEKTMESALNQSFNNIEYLVIDDCGEDGSMEVIEQLKMNHPRGKDIRIIRNERNEGVGASRNHIIDEACGQYLYFLDSDDYIEPNTVSLLLEEALNHEADVVYASLDRKDLVGNSPIRSMILPNLCLLSEDDLAFYAFKNYNSFQISVCNCLMNLKFIRDNKIRFVDAAFWEDMAFTYELVTIVKRAVFLSDITYHYQCRSGSLSHYQEREQLDKNEIMSNVTIINYLKGKCLKFVDKKYLPYLCYNLEITSFYIICHILKYRNRINSKISWQELKRILNHPMSLSKIITFRYKMFPNLFLKILGSIPILFFVPVIVLIGKIKRII